VILSALNQTLHSKGDRSQLIYSAVYQKYYFTLCETSTDFNKIWQSEKSMLQMAISRTRLHLCSPCIKCVTTSSRQAISEIQNNCLKWPTCAWTQAPSLVRTVRQQPQAGSSEF